MAEAVTHWLTLKQAAKLSGMSPRLVLLLCRSGMARARVVRGRWWVYRAALTT